VAVSAALGVARGGVAAHARLRCARERDGRDGRRTLREASSVKITLTTISAVRRKVVKGWTSPSTAALNKGLSTARSNEEMTITTMMTLSKCNDSSLRPMLCAHVSFTNSGAMCRSVHVYSPSPKTTSYVPSTWIRTIVLPQYDDM
jgi:hypothetical protein